MEQIAPGGARGANLLQVEQNLLQVEQQEHIAITTHALPVHVTDEAIN